MFDESTKNIINKKFIEVKKYINLINKEIIKNIDNLSDNKKYLMKYIYSNLPISDIGDYEYSLYLEFVEHSLDVKEKFEWGKNIPTDLFLADVVFPRIYDEKIDDHRKHLFEVFKKYIENEKNMYDAVVKLNYASLEYGTYKSPSRRSLSPLAFLNRTFGRCGEQSTFLVAILRSFCIPARQIYTPRWAHSDDRHAWVEAWCDGQWYYFGACEPEPFLDKGWFNAASTRSMLLLNRVFNNTKKYGNKISEEGPVTTVDRTFSYAKTKKIKVKVIEKDKSVAKAKISFQLVNYAQFSDLAYIHTDENGEVEIVLGIGSVIIHVFKDGRMKEKIININDTKSVIIDFSKSSKNDVVGISEFNMISPKDEGRKFRSLTVFERKIQKEKINYANEVRNQREIAGISVVVDSMSFNNININELNDILQSAKLNGKEIIKFVKNNKKYTLQILKSLDEKDLVDVKSEILEDHLNNSLKYENQHEKEVFVKYILSPRISFEEITPYKTFINNYFTNVEKTDFFNNPKKVWEYVNKNIKYNSEKDFEYIISSPRSILLIKHGNDVSKNNLVVAILRSIGIAARLNPYTNYPEYLNKNSEFIYLDSNYNEKANINIIAEDGINWSYGTNWSISRFENGFYKPLLLMGKKPKDIKNISFISGTYRILTVNRLPNGDTYNKKYIINLEKNNTKTIEIELRKIDFEKSFLNISLNDFSVYKGDKEVKASEVFSEKTNLAIWLGEGGEPTEHVLMEMINMKDILNISNINIVFIGREEKSFKNTMVKKVIANIPKIIKMIDKDFYMQEPIARNMYVNPEQLPLLAVINNGLKAIYGFSGYTVGIVELINNIIKHSLGG